MTPTAPTTDLDARYGDPEATARSWEEAADLLARAEVSWLTTVRPDGRPHVTPLIAVVEQEAVYFCTGLREQKARNLEHSRQVALTTGNNTWAEGLDVVVEGAAVRIGDNDVLQRIADAFEHKYGSAWHFEVGDGVFGTGEDVAAVFRIEPTKVLAFAKQPHGQTAYRFAGR